jgi:hypothetical protein
MNPPARRLYNLSLLLDCLGLACAFTFATSRPGDVLGWWWCGAGLVLIALAYACLGFAETEARR